jgi:hypothetical protein
VTEPEPVAPYTAITDFDTWLNWQIRLAMPRWIPGTKQTGYRDGHVHWPLSAYGLALRLEHLAGLEAHS